MSRTNLTLSFSEILHLYTDGLSKESQERVTIIRDLVRLTEAYGDYTPMTTETFDRLYDMDNKTLRQAFDSYSYMIDKMIAFKEKYNINH